MGKIGLYGRSIGGVVVCHVACKHPEVVQLLICDRTMSTLESTAKCLYGKWAARGLRLTKMMVSNLDNFLMVRCYKLLVCDPKDGMILDLAALRTGVAMWVQSNSKIEERLSFDQEELQQLVHAWWFFSAVFRICEQNDDSTISGDQRNGSPFVPPQDHSSMDVRLKVGESGSSSELLRGRISVGGIASSNEMVSTRWLEEHVSVVQTMMMPVIHQMRSAIDIVGENIEGGGATLDDVFTDYPDEPLLGLQGLLANLQVWGAFGDSLGYPEDLSFGARSLPETESAGEHRSSLSDTDIELFLQSTNSNPIGLLREPEFSVSPECLEVYHHRLASIRVAQVRTEFCRRLGTLQQSLSHVSEGQAGELHEQFVRSVFQHLHAVDSFVSSLARRFKTVKLAPPVATKDPQIKDDESSPERQSGNTSKSTFPDRTAVGYLMHVSCGHNGVMTEANLRQLDLHLRAAGFIGPCFHR